MAHITGHNIRSIYSQLGASKTIGSVPESVLVQGDHMPDTTFICPHCSKSFDVPEAGRGQTMQCPHCQQSTSIPTASGSVEDASSDVGEDAHGTKEKKILLADDDEGIRHIFKRMLNQGIPTARVDEAANGKEALDAFCKERHDVIIMDLRMPIMDGHESFLQIQEFCNGQGVPMPSVVFCTGYSPPGSVQKIVTDNPAHALLLKPTTDICILNAVQQRL